jgi:reactive intermediate/imine deaminase
MTPTTTPTTTRTRISTNAAPAAIGPYSQAILCDGWLWCSGQIALDPATGTVVADGGTDEAAVRAQTTRVIANLAAVLAEGGASFADVVKCTVFVKDLGHFGAVNEEYAKAFGGGIPPARATVEVSRLPRGVLVEIDCVARVPSS